MITIPSLSTAPSLVKLKDYLRCATPAGVGGFALLAVFCATWSLTTNAQAQNPTAAGQVLEEVVITGSRIPRPNLSQPAPVVSVGREEIELSATQDLASVLAEFPAIGATSTIIGNSGNNGFAGLGLVDLRRLGSSRTLVLLDGKRHVAGVGGSASVDLGTIPNGLVERVDVVTGGTSAVYGSDAVSGVVNFIMRQDYEGFEATISGSQSTEGVGARNSSLKALYGRNFLDGRANFTVYADYSETDETLRPDLQQTSNWGTVINPESQSEEDGIPDRLRVPNVLSEFISYTGVLNPFFGNPVRWVFDEAGNPLVQEERAGSNSFAFGSFPDGCRFCFGTEDYRNYQPGVERYNLASTFRYEINPAMDFYADAKYVASDVSQQFQPSFRFGNVNVNIADNAYLNEDIRTQMLDAGIESTRFAKFFDELGNRSADNDRELIRYVTGLEGDFEWGGIEYDYDVFYGYGRTDNTRRTLNDLIPNNFLAALDSVVDPASGQPACRSRVPDLQPEGYTNPADVDPANCLPYNPFGFNQASPAAQDWIRADVTREDEITQRYFGGALTFDTAGYLELPGGPVAFALGFEWREESSETITDELTRSGVLAGAATPDSEGEFDVTEYFVEASLPLLADRPGVQELTLDLAFRDARYDPWGDVEAYKVGLLYSPIENLIIRGTWGKAVRAPNITEAFSPRSPGFSNISDPCDEDNIDDDPDRRANCAQLGIPTGFQANDNVSIDTISGGNPNLAAEASESYTGGIVWTPNFLDDFSLTVDYYEIDIEDAISLIAAQSILDNCVDATGGPDVNFCGDVDRDPETNDVELVRSGYLNAAARNTKGIDIQGRLGFSLENLPGDFNVSVVGNRLLELDFFEFQSRPDEINEEKGEVGDPEWQYRLTVRYILNDLTVNLTTRHLARVVTYDVSPNGGSPEDTYPGYIDDILTSDLSFSYRYNDNLRFTLGARNIFNELPPGYSTNSLFDLIGRRAFANATYNF